MRGEDKSRKRREEGEEKLGKETTYEEMSNEERIIIKRRNMVYYVHIHVISQPNHRMESSIRFITATTFHNPCVPLSVLLLTSIMMHEHVLTQACPTFS